MKRKWLAVVIPLVVLVLLIIVLWPLAPLWQKLGMKPICIQGSWPDLKIVSCPSQQAASVTPIPLPAAGEDGPIPLIVDDDGSPDGMVALLYFLRSPLFDVRAVTISYGEAHPERFALHVSQILAAFGRGDIPVGYGSDTPLEGSNAFPDSWRQASDEFWGIALPQAGTVQVPVPAAALIAKTVSDSERPVAIFVSGSHTNLAEALRSNPEIAANIRSVTIMGGAVHVKGNIHSDWPEFKNEVSEWNIWVDPVAAKEVFSAGLDLHLVPLDATNQVLWSKSDLPGWNSSQSPESALAARLPQMMMQAWSTDSVYIWDLVAAVQATQPAVCAETPMALEIDTAPGPQQGRTSVVDGSPNVSVCLNPEAGQVKTQVVSAFQRP